jgi:LysR family transcriptional regulator, hydrogen peroxide-inducible genes activator
MEIHQIRYFLAVEQARNFSRAAEHCNITQPALTRAIQKLEEEVGGKLFHRRPGQIELTELGRALFPRLEAAYRSISDARLHAQDLVQQRKQRLRLGFMCTIGPDRIGSFLRPLMAAIPNLDLTVREAKGTDVIGDLLADHIDVAVVGLPQYQDGLDVRALYDEQYVIAMPTGHRLAGGNEIALAEMEGENYIERLNCEFDDHFDVLHGEWPSGISVRFRSEREDWVQAMVAAGIGIAIMPESFPLLQGITSAPLVTPSIKRAISLVTVKDRFLPPAAVEFKSLVEAQYWS